ncbi:unnamed protein product [Blepharisma stoltei]|uniref:Uncharacterized protein n=1 Tax=Blepharisma stoltei TaxID=1481888 RepID=A0AAU9IUS4_9CILI|nr:unnamed protein product [Blepharisma stoltei]
METIQDSDEEFYDAVEKSADMVNDNSARNANFNNDISDTQSMTSNNSASAVTQTEDFLTHSPWLPKYKKRDKEFCEFQNFQLSQELGLTQKSQSEFWIMKFSPNGRFLAISGGCCVTSVYEISAFRNGDTQLLHPFPFIMFSEHTRAVTSISWDCTSSRLLSSSLDGTVKLWLIGSESSIDTFQHPCGVNACCFHPMNENYFVTACQDRVIRLYKLPDRKIEGFYQTIDHIFSLAYSAEGQFLAAGLAKGQVMIYESRSTDLRLRHSYTILCRNRSGLRSKGRKVTAVEFMDCEHVLVTTNDSRIRLYKFTENLMMQKYKGGHFTKFPIKASFSQDIGHVIASTERGRVIIWNTFGCLGVKRGVKNQSYECFRARKRKVPEYSIFAPTVVLLKLRECHQLSNDKRDLRHIIITIGAKDTLRVFYNLF